MVGYSFVPMPLRNSKQHLLPNLEIEPKLMGYPISLVVSMNVHSFRKLVDCQVLRVQRIHL